MAKRAVSAVSAVVSVVGLACSRPAPVPASSEPARSTPAPARDDQESCADRVVTFRAWLDQLVGEGEAGVYLPSGIELVALAEPARPIEPASVVFVGDMIEANGAQLAATSTARGVLDALVEIVKAKAQTTLIVVITADAPWSAVTAVAQSAARANVTRLRFVFQGESKLARLGPSAVDAEFDRIAGQAEEVRSIAKRKIFQACPQALPLASAPNLTELVVALPAAIEACGCNVEIEAVARWMWLLWGRDSRGAPQTALDVSLAAAGTKLTAAPTSPWSTTHQLIVAASNAGKPVTFK